MKLTPDYDKGWSIDKADRDIKGEKNEKLLLLLAILFPDYW